MKKKIISVIVPVYKVPERFLTKCIESVINQTFSDIEILLIDDGSPDNSGEICDRYAKKDNRIKVIHQENKGLCGARNSGILNATGDWIMFLDGDDWIEESLCEILYNSIEENIDVICTGYVKDYGNNKVIVNEYSNFFEDNKTYKSNEELRYLQKMTLNFKSYISSSNAKLINKNFINNNNIFFDERLRQGAEGIEFCFRLFSKSIGTKIINKYLYHYMYNDQSISSVPSENSNYMTINCFEKIRKYISNDDTEMLKWYYNRMIYVIITTTISSYFNPTNKEKIKNRINRFNKYLENSTVIEALENIDYSKLDFKRKFVIFCVKNKIYDMLYIMGILRIMQKKNK